MKIWKGSLLTLASQGHVTLQVPDCIIMVANGVSAPEEIETIPDNWLCRLKSRRPAFKREAGCIYFTRAGYLANRGALRKAFEEAVANGRDRTGGRGFAAFEEHAEMHFKSVDKALERAKDDLQNKLDYLDEFVV